jgi:hypothetical protein
MRNHLIVGRVGILSMAAWTMTLDARAQGHGSGHDTYVQGGLEYRIVHISRHAGRFGHTFFATEPETVPYLFIGAPGLGSAALGTFTGGAVVGGEEHVTARHLTGPAGHSLAHVVVQDERGEPLSPQPEAPSALGSDQEGAATAQPDPAASPISQRPPGAAGPGRPVAGWSGPGLAGPGRPASPGW